MLAPEWTAQLQKWRLEKLPAKKSSGIGFGQRLENRDADAEREREGTAVGKVTVQVGCVSAMTDALASPFGHVVRRRLSLQQIEC